ncbi:hypothetical protein [Geobacillus sp. C56-T2]|uniref:hypothetical protein n=1 Tax=Geobacillus sp. C56-T2 TaxID=600773 RepID=UPI0011A574E1|nr:hypothetical protein [Geobacillus sp. C56-T2]
MTTDKNVINLTNPFPSPVYDESTNKAAYFRGLGERKREKSWFAAVWLCRSMIDNSICSAISIVKKHHSGDSVKKISVCRFFVQVVTNFSKRDFPAHMIQSM